MSQTAQKAVSLLSRANFFAQFDCPPFSSIIRRGVSMDYMDKVELNLKEVLKKAAMVLREARSDLPDDPAAQLETIASQVSQPCIVAVVGQVKGVSLSRSPPEM